MRTLKPKPPKATLKGTIAKLKTIDTTNAYEKLDHTGRTRTCRQHATSIIPMQLIVENPFPQQKNVDAILSADLSFRK